MGLDRRLAPDCFLSSMTCFKGTRVRRFPRAYTHRPNRCSLLQPLPIRKIYALHSGPASDHSFISNRHPCEFYLHFGIQIIWFLTVTVYGSNPVGPAPTRVRVPVLRWPRPQRASRHRGGRLLEGPFPQEGGPYLSAGSPRSSSL